MPGNTVSLVNQGAPPAPGGGSPLVDSITRLTLALDELIALQKKQVEFLQAGRADQNPFDVGKPPEGQGFAGTLYEGIKRLIPDFGRAAYGVERSYTRKAVEGLFGSPRRKPAGDPYPTIPLAPAPGAPGTATPEQSTVAVMNVTAEMVQMESARTAVLIQQAQMAVNTLSITAQTVTLSAGAVGAGGDLIPVDGGGAGGGAGGGGQWQFPKLLGNAPPSGQPSTAAPMGKLIEQGGTAAKAALGAAEFAATLILAGIELAKLPFQLRDFGDSILKSSQYLTEYNAVIAVAFARQEIGDVNRALAVGRGTEDSTDRLSNSLNQLKDTLVPSTIAVTNFMNNAGSALAQVGEILAWLTGPMFEALETVGKLMLTNAKLLTDLASLSKKGGAADLTRDALFTGWTHLFTSMNESLDKIIGKETVKLTDLPFGQQIIEFAQLPRGGGGWNGRAGLLPPRDQPLRGPPLPRRP